MSSRASTSCATASTFPTFRRTVRRVCTTFESHRMSKGRGRRERHVHLGLARRDGALRRRAIRKRSNDASPQPPPAPALPPPPAIAPPDPAVHAARPAAAACSGLPPRACSGFAATAACSGLAATAACSGFPCSPAAPPLPLRRLHRRDLHRPFRFRQRPIPFPRSDLRAARTARVSSRRAACSRFASRCRPSRRHRCCRPRERRRFPRCRRRAAGAGSSTGVAGAPSRAAARGHSAGTRRASSFHTRHAGIAGDVFDIGKIGACPQEERREDGESRCVRTHRGFLERR